MSPHHAHGLLGIGQGDVMTLARHAVFQYDHRDAVVVEPRGEIVSFVADGQAHVASARTNHDGLSAGLGGQMHIEASLGGIVDYFTSLPERELESLLRLDSYGHCAKHHQQGCHFLDGLH